MSTTVTIRNENFAAERASARAKSSPRYSESWPLSLKRSLLVCVDGSKKSSQVVNYSIDLAKKLSSSIILTYVAQDEGVPEGYSEYASIENVDAGSYYDAVGEAAIAKSKEELVKSGVQFETLLDIGNPASRIVDLAKARRADMIVIGMHGHKGLNRLRSFGSISRKVLENAPCPVVVVRE